MSSGEDRLIWGAQESLSPLESQYRQNPDGSFSFGQGRNVYGQDQSNQMQMLAEQARNGPQTNIDRYWLDQDIAQGQQSRGMMQQGLGQLREAAMGNAPSQAALMSGMARGQAASSGVGAVGGLAARQAALRSNSAMQQASMQGAGARSDELGRATGAYTGGAQQMMGGDLRQRGQSADEAYRTAKTALRDKEMAAKYGLQYEGLGQGYRFAGTGAARKVRDWQTEAAGARAKREDERSGDLMKAGIGAATTMLSFASGITTKTDIAPAASSPKMGAALQPDQISAAFGPEVAAAVARSRAKYRPQNALSQMPQFSPDVAVAPALARSNDVPVDLAAMQANASVPSDVRAKKDIEMSGKSAKPPGSTGPTLMVGQPVPLPALAPPQEENWIPIAQTAPRGGLARIHSDEHSKKNIDFMAKFIQDNMGYNVKTGKDGVTISKPEDKRGMPEATSVPKEPGGRGVEAQGQTAKGDFENPVFPSGSSKDRFVKENPKGRATPDIYQPSQVMPDYNPLDPPKAYDEPPFGYGYRPSFGKPRQTMVSDENQKSGGPGAKTADAFLDSLSDSASTYRYKDPNLEPSTTGGTGGKYLGIMAQRVEQTPEIGHQLVKDTPQGKVVEGQAMLSALAGGLGRLHQKVKEMEGRRGR